MSTRKYSKIELANNVREAIICRLAVEEAYTHAESLATVLKEASQVTDSFKSAIASVEETLSKIHQQLNSMKNLFDESKMMKLTLYQVRGHRQNIERLKMDLDKITQKCREGNKAAALRVELSDVLEQLERNRDEFEPWLRDIYDAFIEETIRLIDQADQEMQTTGTIIAVAEEISAQINQFQLMRDKVFERQTLDAERQYIAKSLQKVCLDMGFSTKLLSQKGPLEDLILEVNTYAFGIIHFRLQLDGTIRSQSEMIESSCKENFTIIEDQLRSLGVIGSFRYEGDQRPVRLQKDENSLPDSEPTAAMKGRLS